MKTRILSIIGFAVLCSTGLTMAESKRTANYLLTTPFAHEGKDVTLDVASVKPVRWVCPIPGITFFHAMTVERPEYRPGGAILVAVASGDASSFAKKYGTSFERRDSDSLKGTFLAVGGKRPGPGPETAANPTSGPGPGKKIWVIDTTGQLQKLMEQNKLEIPEDAVNEGGGLTGPGGGGRRGPGPR